MSEAAGERRRTLYAKARIIQSDENFFADLAFIG
jgi:hypothetical protein